MHGKFIYITIAFLLTSVARANREACQSALINPKVMEIMAAARLESHKFEVVSLVDDETQKKAENLIDKYPKFYGNNSIRLNLYHGGRKPVAIIGTMPDEIESIVRSHIDRTHQ